ncbi:UNC93-like protein MFSD11 [Paramacrobiotus metropolitanus]|uniref:UNC93-like protein MFSD11 n=1 Tax=Paramacrobiotus metropolitanus TaxID=2943436 RepID=UPI002445BCEA|nr:UNC93-like protein MFSD11 [Paramacrobiotus metropolitanus]
MEKNDVSGPALCQEPDYAHYVLADSVPATPSLRSLPDQPCSTKRRSLMNVILLGFGFMLNMGSILTAGMAQTVVLHSVFDDATLGYLCLAVNCGSQAIAYLVGPSFCFFMGPKFALVLGSNRFWSATAVCTDIAVIANIAGLIKPVYWVIFVCAAISGFGVGIVWAVQGYFLTSHSTPN